ncbi:PREDICTED: pentatricopeptide repeat-containing protein At5g50990 isoform X2 [Theobroma cacao]|uniref:Pentatricopeptide repeat-containing protein At5g50990 isoform X2 n=1 Tax=Theobroma cacao TaxID=3641 RepID=A0AB32W442_THECC|nr:PREDICTED: pentatricopeptide repeat-containing protein At5g50990 isoform X2 [Theobroma cacao]
MQRNGVKKLIQQTSAAIRYHRTVCEILEACKLSSDYKTASAIHAIIFKLGYGTYPSLVTTLISTYLQCGWLVLAHQLIDQVFRSDCNLVILNLVIEHLMKLGEYGSAKKVFHKMPVRDLVTWNIMIGGYVRNARFEEALTFFREMLGSNVKPDKFTFASVITGCARLGALNHALWVHSLITEKEIELNAILNAALIDMYSKCGRIHTAKEVFNSAEHNDVSIWNAMINGLAIHGLAFEAIAVFSKMRVENILPDSITFIVLLTACSHSGLVEEGQKYFDLMSGHYSIQPQIEHYGAMVDLYGRAGQLEEAYAIIKAMPMEPDIVIWRALLSACRTYRKPELGEVAIANISRLESGDYVLLSNIYCSVKKWESAEGLREMMKKKGIRKIRGRSWIELGGIIHRFKAGDRSHPETEGLYKVLEGLIQRTKLKGFLPETELVLMDISEEEKEGNLNHHSEKLALAYGILKTSPGTEIMISKNLRICHDCHNWIKMVSKLLIRVIIVRDRIRFHRFEGGLCSCADYW